MRILFVCLALIACTTQVPVSNNPADYPVIDNDWPAAKEFCERHVKAAKTKPEYIVDICVIACETDPTHSWCEDLKALND